MDKISVFFSFLLIFIMHTYAGTASKFTVSINGNKGECKFDYGEIDFCSNYYLNLYQKSLNLNPNFNKNYILLDVSQDGSIVVVDPIHKEAFPLYGEYYDGENEDGKVISDRILKFSKDDNKICIKGMKYAYRDLSYNGTYCYQFLNNEFENFYPNKKVKVIKNDIIAKSLEAVTPVKLPFNSKSKTTSINFKGYSEKLYTEISNLGGEIDTNDSILRLPNKNNIYVFMTYYGDDGTDLSYKLYTYYNGTLYYKDLGTGSDFWIDENYKIKVREHNGKKSNILYYNIFNDGYIISSKNPF
ncbi:hypothetical protein [Acinetobacter sp. MB5]|uniref:hypothetical protein n=1 Tax=Acinetobacter sp. MB5 TaxID=2069438 RepID=UPI000DD0A06F|nr:hypothetical protein [Acinetobacter sp. MB5]